MFHKEFKVLISYVKRSLKSRNIVTMEQCEAFLMFEQFV